MAIDFRKLGKFTGKVASRGLTSALFKKDKPKKEIKPIVNPDISAFRTVQGKISAEKAKKLATTNPSEFLKQKKAVEKKLAERKIKKIVKPKQKRSLVTFVDKKSGKRETIEEKLFQKPAQAVASLAEAVATRPVETALGVGNIPVKAAARAFGNDPKNVEKNQKALLDFVKQSPKKLKQGVPIKQQLQEASDNAKLSDKDKTAFASGEMLFLLAPFAKTAKLNTAIEAGKALLEGFGGEKTVRQTAGGVAREVLFDVAGGSIGRGLDKLGDVGKVARGAVTGAGAGTVASIGEDIVAGEGIKPEKAATMAGLGGALGGVLGGFNKDIVPKPEALDPLDYRVRFNELVTPRLDVDSVNVPKPIIDEPLGLPTKRVTGEGFKESKLKKGTLSKPEVTDPKMQSFINEMDMMYEVKPEPATYQKAYESLEADYLSEFDRLMKSKGSFTSAEDTAKAGIIYKQAARTALESGDFSTIGKVVKQLRSKTTNTAQALQALNGWKIDTPESALMRAQKIIDISNKVGLEKSPRLFKVAKLNDGDIQFILETADEALKMPMGRARDVKLSQLESYVEAKRPRKFLDTAVGAVKMSMLTSPSTGITNNVANFLKTSSSNLSQPLSGLADIGVSKFTGVRKTPIIPSFGAQAKGAVKGGKRMALDFWQGVDTSSADTSFADLMQGNKKGYLTRDFFPELSKNPKIAAVQKLANTQAAVLRKAEDWVKLNVRDDIFYEAAYAQRIDEFKRLNKGKTVTDQVKIDADRYAKERVFQEDSKLAKTALEIRKQLGLFGDVTMPFARTPANILKDTIETIPATATINLGKQLLVDLPRGVFDQKKFTDSVGKLGLGVAISKLGADWYKKGIYDPSTAENSKERALNSALNIQTKTIKLGDKNYDIGNFPPLSAVLSYGAEVEKRKEMSAADRLTSPKTEDIIKDNLEATMLGFDGILDASFLQGVNQFGTAIGRDGMTKAVVGAFADIPNMAVPNLIKRFNQSTDPYYRQTYSQNPVDELVNGLRKEVNFGSDEMLPRRDVFGDRMERETFVDPKLNLPQKVGKYGLNLINPIRRSTPSKDPIKNEIKKIYDDTKDSSIIPRVVNQHVLIHGIKLPLTDQEYNDYVKLNGRRTTQVYRQAIEMIGQDYNRLNSEQKAQLLSKAMSQSKVNKQTDNDIKKRVLERLEKDDIELYNVILEEVRKSQQ